LLAAAALCFDLNPCQGDGIEAVALGPGGKPLSLLLSAPSPYTQNERTDTQQAQCYRLGYNNDFQIWLGRIAIFIQHC